jgi:putative ABC transport system permease protein
MHNKKLGYDKDQVLIVQDTWMLGKNQEAFRQVLLSDPRVAMASGSRYVPAGQSDNNNFFISPSGESSQMIKTLRYEVDENYIPVLGIKLKEGRNFSRAFGTDSNAVVINEAAANALGWKQGAVGKTIYRDNHGKKESYNIIGIVNDFHFRSFHERISPLLMVLAPDQGTLIVKLKTKESAGLTAMLKKRWTAFGAEDPLSYSFLDERYNNTYKAEQKIGSILGIFAGLTIFVACLGLFGLAKFTAERRTKEIGIRKVLGSSVSGIVNLLSLEFLKLVLLAFVIASPIAWFIMNKWLQDFAYRVNISWWVFAIAVLLTILITILTISFQAIKAAIANPIKSLRTE